MILQAINRRGTLHTMKVIAEAIQRAGGSTKLGKALGITRQAVEAWKGKGRVVPPEHVLEIEKITGVTRYDLRPDIYGAPPVLTKRRSEARVA